MRALLQELCGMLPIGDSTWLSVMCGMEDWSPLSLLALGGLL